MLQLNTCGSRLKAVDHANSRYSQGYAATGVGVVVCARHTFICKNGACDLQKGERYANMDYIFLSAASHKRMPQLLVIYDIACQWHKNLPSRIQSFPQTMHIDLNQVEVTYCIPKAHISAHGESCQVRFSLNYLPGCGRTDGEGVERDWATMNSLVTSTREMGRGNRQETLDDHWGAWNWRKVTAMGERVFLCMKSSLSSVAGRFLKQKLLEALNNYNKQLDQLEEQRSTFSEEKVIQWDGEISRWNQNPIGDGPYSKAEQGKT